MEAPLEPDDRRRVGTGSATRPSDQLVYLVDTNVLSAAGPTKAFVRQELIEWLETLLHLYGARVLPVGLEVARRLGGLADRARGTGQAPGLADLAIAATAQAHGHIVLTRNLRHFDGLGMRALDPFQALPPEVRG